VRRLSIPSLDGIRALAWGVVFFSHAVPAIHFPGQFGVTVFFFLSGYLITTLMRVEHEDSGGVDLRAFYLRRALRILPPFYIVLGVAIAFALLGVTDARPSPAALGALALHYVNYHVTALGGWQDLPTGTAVYWSLAVEEHFYLLFPWLFLLLQRRLRGGRTRAFALLGLCALVLAWRSWLVFAENASQLRTFVATDTRVDSLLFGCVLALYGNPALDPLGAVPERVWKWALFPLGLAGLLVSFALGGQLEFRESVRYTIQGILLIPVFVTVVRWPTWLPVRFLNHPAVKFVGVLSYSLYLLHMVVIGALEHYGVHGVWLPVAALALCLAGSFLLHVSVERPLARVRKQLHASRPSARPAAAPSA